MAERQVLSTRKDGQGDITALCSKGADWSPRKKEDAIGDIEGKKHSYHLMHGEKRYPVTVVAGKKGKYLKATWDASEDNHLLSLAEK